MFYTGCSLKIVFFSQFTAAHPLDVEEQLILARDLSVHLPLLDDQFCTANSSQVLAKEMSQNEQPVGNLLCVYFINHS